MNELFDSSFRPVLVVEDSDEDFDTVLEATQLSGLKNRIVHAATADEAWEMLPQGTPFAFVLLDHNLPGMPGSEFLRELRQKPAYRTLPVVVYTTSTNPRYRESCYRAGANAYHVKSVRFDQSLQTLTEIFHYWLRSAVLPDPQRGAGENRGAEPRAGS